MIASAAVVAGAALASCATESTPRATGTPTAEPSDTTTGSVPAVTASASVRPEHRGPAGPDITHGAAGSHAVALTFHGAGDPSLARQVLREFRNAAGHGTILAVGTWLDANPSMATEVLDGGHDLGNHTWSHLVMPDLSASAAQVEVARCAALLERRVGNRGAWFRPSGTPVSTPVIRAAAGKSGYANCLSYDVDPLDYTDPGADLVRSRVLAAARGGRIVSMHLGHAGTVAALPGILDGLRTRGLRAVTVTQLLASTQS